MRGLATHLRPAPYPYGLLTLRLLGKIGGKNRKVLREPMDVTDPSSISSWAEKIKVEFGVSDDSDEPMSDPNTAQGDPAGVDIHLPIDGCVRFLRDAALRRSRSEKVMATEETTKEDSIRWDQHDKLLEVDLMKVNLASYCSDVINETTKHQVEASIRVLRSASTQIMGREANEKNKTIDLNGEKMDIDHKLSHLEGVDMQSSSARAANYDSDLQQISLGLMYACVYDFDDQVDFVKGLLTNTYLVVASHEQDITIIDSNGSSIEPQTTSGEGAEPSGEDGEHDHATLKSFGNFELNGPLAHTTNPLAVNAALANFLAEPSLSNVGIDLVRHLLSLPSAL